MAERKKAGIGQILISSIVALIVVIAGRWFYYVEYSADPDDEIGIAINTHLPPTLVIWACHRLSQRHFGTSVPTPGCGRFTGPEIAQ